MTATPPPPGGPGGPTGSDGPDLSGRPVVGADPAVLFWQSLSPDAQGTWRSRFAAAQDGEFDAVKSAADKWAGTLTGLIGALGAISVLVVPKALGDFNSVPLRDATFALVLTAGVLGLVALVLVTLVAQGWPQLDPTMDSAHFAYTSVGRALRGASRLRWSRLLTGLAVVLIVAASVLSQVDTIRAPASGVEVLVVHRDGHATCEPLTHATSAGDVATVITVPSC